MIYKLKFNENDFSTTAWLYQMPSGGHGGFFTSSKGIPWYPSSYINEISERDRKITWTPGKIYFRNYDKVDQGSTVIFFFCKTGENDPKTGDIQPGIYGWGTIINPQNEQKLTR
jgi:hypothetical protein